MAVLLNPSSSSSSKATPPPPPQQQQQQLLLLLLHLLLVAVPATSLTFSYDADSFVSEDFRQEDDAMVTAGRIELLGEEFAARARGRALYKRPVQLWDGTTGEEASFAASFNFTIRSVAGKGNALAGHGITFFLAPFMPDMPQECYEGCLGLFDQSLTRNTASAMGNASGAASFVAVEFDTHMDGWDPSGRHVGVDVNNVDSRRGKYVVLPEDSLVDAGVMSATVAYDSSATRLDVALAVGGAAATATYNLSAAVHLRSVLPEQVAVGFSAATGDRFASNHTVLSFTFSSTLPTRSTSPPSPSTSSSKTAHLSAAVAAAGAVLLLLVLAITILIRRANKRRRRDDGDDSSVGGFDDDEEEEDMESGTGPRRIPYAQLAAATGGFAEIGKLGEGGSGSVYGGHVRELGRDVAIKVFTRGASMEGRKEYRSEVTVISRLRHRNLVQLMGWCHGRRRLLLVYELVRNGSLDGHLYSDKETLTWPLRYQIINGLASAVLYLHQEWDQCVVHGDIKPSNIMLDESFNAKLGDFGLARLIDHGMSLQTMTAVAGTPGYLDPECVITGKASTESDMYSFGIVLLEVASGRRPMVVAPRAAAATGGGKGDDEDGGGGQVFRLVEWAWELYGRGDDQSLDAVADARLGGAFDRWEMERVVGVGLWCAHPDPKARPAIRKAAEALQSRKFRMPVLPPRMPVAVYLQPFTASTMKYYGDSMTSVGSEVVGYSSTSLATATLSSSSSLPSAMANNDSLSPRE
uniref:non-specific serine/threonine protein kinase n=1 Tax=Oryza meridionalis TaxID=40149 RepID=A0A0E0DC12_9ORYZ